MKALMKTAAEAAMERTRTREGLKMMWMGAILSVSTATRRILAIPHYTLI
jgi:hypothetical protein